MPRLLRCPWWLGERSCELWDIPRPATGDTARPGDCRPKNYHYANTQINYQNRRYLLLM